LLNSEITSAGAKPGAAAGAAGVVGDATGAPAVFKVKLVDFGADGGFGGGDDVEHELTLSAATSPALATGSWVRLDLPLASFTNLTTRGHLAQLIISGSLGTVFVDNVLLHR